MILKAFSKGLYSNWYYYAPDRVLFDCGEGAILHLKTGIFAIEKIFISHGHVDHIAGLPSFACLRQSTKGDNEKPLTIYYPEKDRSVLLMKEFVNQMAGRFIKYPLNWEPINAGDRIEVRKGRIVEAFSARHSGDDPLGFRILEQRKRLKPEMQGKPGEELAKIPTADKFDYFEANKFSYSGDSMPLAPDLFAGAEILIYDATFLKASDRKAPIHATAQEVFDLAKEAAVDQLILTHISPRYESYKRICGLIDKLDNHGLKFDFIPHNRTFEI